MRIGKASLVVVALAVLVLAMAGCSKAADDAAQPRDAHPYAAQLDALREHIESPDLLAALDDYTITDEELARGQQVALECFSDRGYSATYDDDGGLSVPHPDGASQADVDAAVDQCATYNYDLLRAYRQSMEYNPQNIPRATMLADCFRRMGLIDESMTVDEFRQIDRDNPPWDRLDGDVHGCREDPLHYQGGRPDLTPAEAGYGTDIDGNPVP